MKHFLLLILVTLIASCTKDAVNYDISPEQPAQSRTTYTISGTVLWETLPVQSVTVKLTGAETATTITDASGNYSFTVSSSGSYTITPSKTINLLNGCDTADVSAIQRHVTLTTTINDSYRRVAADVNKSGTITSLDASLLNQALLGSQQAQQIMKPSWRFVDAAYSLPLPSNPVQAPTGFPQTISVNISGDSFNNNFIGIKTGDVNGTANPQI